MSKRFISFSMLRKARDFHRAAIGEDARRVIDGHVDEDDAGGHDDLLLLRKRIDAPREEVDPDRLLERLSVGILEHCGTGLKRITSYAPTAAHTDTAAPTTILAAAFLIACSIIACNRTYFSLGTSSKRLRRQDSAEAMNG